VQYKSLYLVLQKIIARTIPLWNQTLTGLKSAIASDGVRIKYDRVKYDPDPANGPDEHGPRQQENEEDYQFWERRDQWIKDTRRIVKPEPTKFRYPFYSRSLNKKLYNSKTELKQEYIVDLFKDFKSRGLQIIVKLANIHLSPEKPNYAGGTWHVEGQLVSNLYLLL
jgi:hypothetical protein